MSNVSFSFRVRVFDLPTSPLVWRGRVPADGGKPRGQAENNSIRRAKTAVRKNEEQVKSPFTDITYSTYQLKFVYIALTFHYLNDYFRKGRLGDFF